MVMKKNLANFLQIPGRWEGIPGGTIQISVRQPSWLGLMHSFPQLPWVYISAKNDGRHLLQSQTTFKAQSAVLVIKTSSTETTPNQDNGLIEKATTTLGKESGAVNDFSLSFKIKFNPIFCFRHMGMPKKRFPGQSHKKISETNGSTIFFPESEKNKLLKERTKLL